MERCEQCGTKIRGAGTTTVTGRRLCGSCGDAVVGASIGMMTGDLGTAVALGYSKTPDTPRGVLHWIRKALGRD